MVDSQSGTALHLDGYRLYEGKPDINHTKSGGPVIVDNETGQLFRVQLVPVDEPRLKIPKVDKDAASGEKEKATPSVTPGVLAPASGPHVEQPSAPALLSLSTKLGLLKNTARTGWLRKGVPEHVGKVGPHVESVSDHSWRMALLAGLLGTVHNGHHAQTQRGSDPAKSEPGEIGPIDLHRCILMSLIHDAAEGLVGDLVVEGDAQYRDKISKEEKEQREELAMRKILFGDALAGEQDGKKEGKKPPTTLTHSLNLLFELWREYEDQATEEARFVKDMDKLEMLVQAHEYEVEARALRTGRTGLSRSQPTAGPLDLSDFYRSTDGKFKSGVARALDAELRRLRDVRLTQRAPPEGNVSPETGT